MSAIIGPDYLLPRLLESGSIRSWCACACLMQFAVFLSLGPASVGRDSASLGGWASSGSGRLASSRHAGGAKYISGSALPFLLLRYSHFTGSLTLFLVASAPCAAFLVPPLLFSSTAPSFLPFALLSSLANRGSPSSGAWRRRLRFCFVGSLHCSQVISLLCFVASYVAYV